MSRDRPFHLDEAREALDQAYADLDGARSDLARVTAERDAAVASVDVLKSNMGIIAMAHKDANDVMHSALADVDNWKATLAVVAAERDALKAEVEAMRAVVDRFIEAETTAATRPHVSFGIYVDAMEKARALRTRKAGGT